MKLGPFLAATLAAWAAMEAMAYLLHLQLLFDFYQAAVPAETLRPGGKSIPVIAAGQLVLAVLMVVLYQVFLGAPQRWLRASLLFGLLVGLIWRLPHALMEIGLSKVSVAAQFVDSAAHCLEAVVGAVALGFVFERFRRGATQQGTPGDGSRPAGSARA